MVICPRCGRETPAAIAHCEFCGMDLVTPSPGDAAHPLEASDRPLTSFPRSNGGTAAEKSRLVQLLMPIGYSSYAVAAGYLGLLSMVFCFLGPLAILLGLRALRETHEHPSLRGRQRALLAIVLGVVGSIGLLLVIAAVFRP